MPDLGEKKWHTISSRLAKRTYELWVRSGVSFANHVCSVASRIYNYATEMEYGNHNPFSAIRRKSTKPRRVVWAKEQVRQFLDFAYDKLRVQKHWLDSAYGIRMVSENR